jgi:hypothetical protein
MIGLMGAGFGLAAAVGGVFALHRGWRRRPNGPWLAGGWALLALGLLGWAATAGLDMAAALALLVPSLVGYTVLALKAEFKPKKRQRPSKPAVELPEAPGGYWRTLVRTLYAGPLAAVAAVAAGAAVALHAPLGEADRLIAGGMLVPALWGLGMIWATTDERLSRIGLGLGAGAAVMLAAAAL